MTNSIVLICCTIFNEALINIDNGNFIAAVATICGLIMLTWAYDIIMVAIKKFKIPVSIDLDSEIITEVKQ